MRVIQTELKSQSSTYKRDMEFQKNEVYVEPKEMAIGLRWERQLETRLGRKVFVPRLIQSSFQFVSIVETLCALFLCKDFRDAYFRHNSTKHHECREGMYYDFCCGSSFKSEFFKKNPKSIKIQIYSDEFEICNPLQSKAGINKYQGIYFSIRNMPREFQSKLRNIFLISLCNANDIKTMTTDHNDVWHPIARDLAYLEEVGIDVNGENIKGTLTHLSLDNAEGNLALGFAGSFSALYYCRFCILPKSECQITTIIDPSKNRTIDDYENQLKIVSNSEKVNYAETKGVKCKCALNDLKYFHVINNPTCDVMHDHFEGSIPHVLRAFFEMILKLKLCTDVQLDFRLQFHDYGWLNRKNTPSQIHVLDKKRSLGQNATQSALMFRNCPFILYEFKDIEQLSALWKCIQDLLQILTIICSYEVSEDDLIRLDKTINSFLEGVIANINSHLIPKLHILLHYSSIIRKVGPVMYMNTIRYESKHQEFKNIMKQTNNFQNIAKTMAIGHQQKMCAKGSAFCNEIEFAKRTIIPQITIDQNLGILMEQFVNLSSVEQVEWLKMNNFEYRENILIIHNAHFFMIHKIFVVGSSYFFLSKQYEILSFDVFLNSYKISENVTSDSILIEFSTIRNKKPYEMKIHNRERYVIEEDLEIQKTCVLNL